MEAKKYISLNRLSIFLDNLKNLFATKTSVEKLSESLDNKVNSSALSDYYTKTEINNLELITADDINTICGTNIQVTSINDSEVTF